MLSRSQIVATIGPASGDKDMLLKLIAAGMDVARLNFSHGDYKSHADYIKNIREAAAESGKRIPIIQDLSGPRMSTGSGHEFDAGQSGVVTAKDLADLDFGISQKVDYVAQSYIGSAEDIILLKSEIAKRGADIPVIAKIERAEAVSNFDTILVVADAVMIARGDLGLSVPLEDIPFIEKDIISKCKQAGKPVITATQMLYSMVDNENPTRAEVTDVAYAILMSSDAVMLSEETAIGKYPLRAVEIMEKIVKRVEGANPSEVVKSL